MTKKTSPNIELARQIVDHFAGDPIETEVVVQPGIDRAALKKSEFPQLDADVPAKKVEEKTETRFFVSFLALGYTISADDTTAEKARQTLAQHIADDLDEGRLTLSDTWAEDNLRG